METVPAPREAQVDPFGAQDHIGTEGLVGPSDLVEVHRIESDLNPGRSPARTRARQVCCDRSRRRRRLKVGNDRLGGKPGFRAAPTASDNATCSHAS